MPDSKLLHFMAVVKKETDPYTSAMLIREALTEFVNQRNGYAYPHGGDRYYGIKQYVARRYGHTSPQEQANHVERVAHRVDVVKQLLLYFDVKDEE